MLKNRTYALTVVLLQNYAAAALQNSRELLTEATLLEENGFQARAYFLAVASIEETGKAALAFDAQGRKLGNLAVAQKIRRTFDDHSAKITAAFTPWLLKSANINADVRTAVKLMVDLKFGREPSMYTDILEDGTTVQLPSNVVRPLAGRECIRLAKDCYAHADRLIRESEPTATTPEQDEFFAMKRSVTKELMNTEDFWEFHISQVSLGQRKLEENVIAYRRDYVQKRRKFNFSPSGETDA